MIITICTGLAVWFLWCLLMTPSGGKPQSSRRRVRKGLR